MDDSKANQKKAELDKALEGKDPNTAVIFGEKLFNEFRKREWFTLEIFGLLGTRLFAEKLPAYGKSHWAVMSWDVPDDEFRVS